MKIENKHTVDSVLIRRLLSYLVPDRGWVLFAIFILILSKGIEAWIPIQIGRLAQLILDHSNTNGQSLFYFVLRTSLVIIGWILLVFVLDSANIFIKNWVGQKAVFNLRMQVYTHIQKLPISFYDHYPVGKLMTRTIHDIDQINQLFTESVIPLIGSLFLFVGILIGIWILDWRLGLAIGLILPLIWWFTNQFRSRQRQSYDAVRSIVSIMNAFVQEQLMGIAIIRNFNLSQQERKRFDEINIDHLKANVETIHHFAVFFAGIEFLQNLAMIIVFVILAQTASDSFPVGIYLTFSLYGLMVFRPLFDIAERYNVLQSAMAAAERVFEILDIPTEPAGPQPGLTLEKIESIVFDQVWFAYEGENWVLKGISFAIQEGEAAALVGVTGSGKTSIMNLLLRLYEFQKGRILINGYDIRQYVVSTLRQQFSVILQDPVIFSGTIQDNITLYDSSITKDQVESAVQYVHLNQLINRLPKQLQHSLKERGTDLSVGEMQLIALARAIVHARCMLIFDEATSNIDLQTEKLIQQALKKILVKKNSSSDCSSPLNY